MIEDSKNLGVLRAVALEPDEIEKIKSYSNSDIEVDLHIEGLDFIVVVANYRGKEHEFIRIIEQIKLVLDKKLYSDNDETLEECVVKNALAKGIRISVAESLTGGMLASRIVNVSGSSAVLYEGVVTYTNASKVRRLHVKLSTLKDHGAVSEETAREMASSLLSKEVDYVISTTGCAGPNSDENDTPIGLVYVGIADKNGVDIHELHLEGTRNQIRKSVTDIALILVLNKILNK